MKRTKQHHIVYISNINRFVAYKNPFRYRSYYYDFETGLYYLNSRYYDPKTGRFINADDISVLSEGKEFINGLNLFAYCNNNPVMLTDTYGTSWWSDLWGGTIGNIAGTIITDSLNGVNVINSTYIFRLLAISTFSGLTAVGAFNFGNETKILKTFGFNKLFAAVTVWAEFMFSSLFDAIKSFIENFSRSIGTKKLYKF